MTTLKWPWFPDDGRERGWFIDGNSTRFGPLPEKLRSPSLVRPMLPRAGSPPQLSKEQQAKGYGGQPWRPGIDPKPTQTGRH